MDLRKLKTLVDLVSESNISELEITEAEGKVRIVKADPNRHPPQMQMVAAMPAAASPAVAVAPAAAAAAEPVEEAGHAVASPMVGTFYRSASPGANPFVEVGSVVKEGDPICIIEAMKIMNEIEAEVTGVVREVLADDTQPVEFGTVLFRVDPNG